MDEDNIVVPDPENPEPPVDPEPTLRDELYELAQTSSPYYVDPDDVLAYAATEESTLVRQFLEMKASQGRLSTVFVPEDIDPPALDLPLTAEWLVIEEGLTVSFIANMPNEAPVALNISWIKEEGESG